MDMPIVEAAAVSVITGKRIYNYVIDQCAKSEQEASKLKSVYHETSNYVRQKRNPAIAILQLREGEEYNERMFKDLPESAADSEDSRKLPNCHDYELVYVRDNNTKIETFGRDREYDAQQFQDTLNKIYKEFNADTLRPSDYYGHSVSVGDIIVISDAWNGLYSFYVNSKGFTMLPENFLSARMKAKIYNKFDIKQESFLLERVRQFNVQNSVNLMDERLEDRYSQIRDNYSDIFEMAERRQLITDMELLGYVPVMGRYKGYNDNLLNWDLKGYVSAEEEPALAFDGWDEVRAFLNDVRILAENYTLRELQDRENEDFSIIPENAFSYEAVVAALKMAERRQIITDMDRLGFEPVMGKHSDGLLRWDQKGYASDEEEAALVVDSWEGVKDFIDKVRTLTQNYTLRELQDWEPEAFDVAVWAALMNYSHPEETFKLTGHEISSELRDVLKELAIGRYVTLEKINECPEIILANTIVSDSKPTMLLAGRDDLRKHILEELNKKGAAGIANDGSVCYNKEVIRESRLDIIVGLPGSGKSSALADVISQEFNSRIIDSDEAKKLLPEYNNGWGASIVHNESKLISDTQLKESMLKGENIVLPRVGGNYKVIDQIVSMAKQLGYSVYIHYVELSREKALGRMLDRFINTGRFMAPEIIDKYDNNIDGNKIEKTYEYFKKGGNINGYSKWNNDVGRGESPILIEQSGCSGRFILSAEQAVNVQCLGGHGTYGTRGLDDGISASGTYAKTGHENNREDIQKSSGGTRPEDGTPDEREQPSERGRTAGEGAPFSGSGYGRDSESYGAGTGTLSRRRGR